MMLLGHVTYLGRKIYVEQHAEDHYTYTLISNRKRRTFDSLPRAMRFLQDIQ